MENSTGYPPAPWPLEADMFVALVKMPPDTVPRHLLPPGIDFGRPDRPMNLAAAFVDYRPGGAMVYREFLVTTANRTLTCGTILAIWVDSPESLAGGRELWFIPKQSARFKFDVQRGFTGSVFTERPGQSRETASLSFTPTRTFPGRWSYRTSLVQQSGDTVRKTVSKFRSRFQLGTGELHVPEDSEVAFLRRGTPYRFVALRNLSARFGVKSTDSPPHPTARTATTPGPHR